MKTNRLPSKAHGIAEKMSSNPLLWAAIGSIGASLLLRLPIGRGVRRMAGRWATPLVFMGLYNRLKAGKTGRG